MAHTPPGVQVSREAVGPQFKQDFQRGNYLGNGSARSRSPVAVNERYHPPHRLAFQSVGVPAGQAGRLSGGIPGEFGSSHLTRTEIQNATPDAREFKDVVALGGVSRAVQIR